MSGSSAVTCRWLGLAAGLAAWLAASGCGGHRSGDDASTDAADPSGTDDTDTDTCDPPVTTAYPALRAELEAAGFLVADGDAAELATDDCCAWDSCYLFNPDNSYLGWYVPRGPGQLAANPAEREDGRSLVWRLRPDEAIIAVGRTPPPAAYFSYRSYLHDRWYPDLGKRDWLFFNLGDSLNQFVMGTREGTPFDAEFMLITTADAGTDAAIRAAAERAGLPAAMINTDAIAGDDLRMGLEPEADTFRLQARMALFDDLATGQAYVDDPPITVFRVTPATEQPHVQIVPPPLRPRGSGTDESAWAGSLDALDAAIRAAYPDYTATVLPSIVPTADDDECPPGCNRDTFFGVTLHYFLPEWADAFVVVFGVNHERTGKSVYSNFSVVDAEHLSAIEGLTSREMPGTARVYVDDPLVDDLYAYTVARTCADDTGCVEVPLECPGFPSVGQGSFAFRAYTEASTGTGPLVSELLVDRAILFTRPAESLR